MTIITLLTDFGLQDGYPGVMKGVIWNISPRAQIADISHSIRPQDIFQGALVLRRTVPYFPSGTIHVAVVDPGVGTHRRPIGLHLGDQYFIGPDNGLFTLVLELAESRNDPIQVMHLNQNKYWLPEVSCVFHGRDIFAPCAAHLACGVKLSDMGTPISDPVRIPIPRPVPIHAGGWHGQVIEIDTFGNLATNLERSHILPMGAVSVHVAGQEITGLVSTFGDRPAGTLIALYGTAQDLIISVINGNAAQALNVSLGEVVEVYPLNRANQP